MRQSRNSTSMVIPALTSSPTFSMTWGWITKSSYTQGVAILKQSTKGHNHAQDRTADERAPSLTAPTGAMPTPPFLWMVTLLRSVCTVTSSPRSARDSSRFSTAVFSPSPPSHASTPFSRATVALVRAYSRRRSAGSFV